MATPDGMPVAWTLRLNGFPNVRRISGPDLMLDILSHLDSGILPVYFYGSTKRTLARLTQRMRDRFPNLKIAGSYAPPFRSLSAAEDADIISRINDSGAGIIFVGLGCPKQELWVADHLGKISAVMIGVGAAFDFHAGNITRAPLLLQKSGLEWFYRLCNEPRRLFKRYFTTNIMFIKYVLQRKLVTKCGDSFQSKV
jgi:N-acetylglucosaminyldiphosphoundecaprenol N-acetyl-beta-D-mannosaminyltransferase